jgi:putative permease
VIVLQIVEQVIESSVVSPLVMGKEVRIHPLAVLSAFIFFGGLFGFVGVLLAVPMAGMTQAVIRYLRTRDVKASEAS